MSGSVFERIYLGLGSNLQVPEHQLDQALRLLEEVPGLRRLAVSSYYRTAPWGNREQPNFVNAVVAMDCALTPAQLLDRMLSIERGMGRQRDGMRWAPRTIDLDLLFFGERSLSTSSLSLPHPHASERAFVLVPLIEVAMLLADSRRLKWQQWLGILPHDDVVRLLPESRPAASI